MSKQQPMQKRVRAPRGGDPTFESRYPNISAWVKNAWGEIGRDDCGRAFARALDIGGLVWEGDGPYRTTDDALRALDTGIAEWVAAHG